LITLRDSQKKSATQSKRDTKHGEKAYGEKKTFGREKKLAVGISFMVSIAVCKFIDCVAVNISLYISPFAQVLNLLSDHREAFSPIGFFSF